MFVWRWVLFRCVVLRCRGEGGGGSVFVDDDVDMVAVVAVVAAAAVVVAMCDASTDVWLWFFEPL